MGSGRTFTRKSVVPPEFGFAESRTRHPGIVGSVRRSLPGTAFLRSAAPGRPSPPSRRALHQTGPSLHREWGILLPVIALSYGRTITHLSSTVKVFSPKGKTQEKIIRVYKRFINWSNSGNDYPLFYNRSKGTAGMTNTSLSLFSLSKKRSGLRAGVLLSLHKRFEIWSYSGHIFPVF